MISDRRPILLIEAVTVRCDECPRQITVYASNHKLLGFALADVGWEGQMTEDAIGVEHFCPEHAS